MKNKFPKERYYIKDKVDGQQYCISGDEHFYITDVTDKIYPVMVQVGIYGMLEWQSCVRREIINILDRAYSEGKIKQRDRDIFYYRHIDWNSLENCAKNFGLTKERIRQIDYRIREVLRMYDD